MSTHPAAAPKTLKQANAALHSAAQDHVRLSFTAMESGVRGVSASAATALQSVQVHRCCTSTHARTHAHACAAPLTHTAPLLPTHLLSHTHSHTRAQRTICAPRKRSSLMFRNQQTQLPLRRASLPRHDAESCRRQRNHHHGDKNTCRAHRPPNCLNNI